MSLLTNHWPRQFYSCLGSMATAGQADAQPNRLYDMDNNRIVGGASVGPELLRSSARTPLSQVLVIFQQPRWLQVASHSQAIAPLSFLFATSSSKTQQYRYNPPASDCVRNTPSACCVWTCTDEQTVLIQMTRYVLLGYYNIR